MSDFNELNSIGFLSQRFGVSPRTIAEAFRRLGIGPAVTINGVAFYDEIQTAKLHCELINSGALEHVTIQIPVEVAIDPAEEVAK